MDQMSQWEAAFAKRLCRLHDRSGVRFRELLQAEVDPAFERIKAFVETGGMNAEPADAGDHHRSYRFTVADHLALHVAFALTNLYQAEVTYRIERPDDAAEPSLLELGTLPQVTEGWARQLLQQALDRFMDTLETLCDGATAGGRGDRTEAEADPPAEPDTAAPALAEPV